MGFDHARWAPHLAPYVAAKFAVAGLADALRAELRGDGISVTTVVPGLLRTGSPHNALFKGNGSAEYRWFTLGDSIPGVSMDAERAARRVVDGALRGRGQIVLTGGGRPARLVTAQPRFGRERTNGWDERYDLLITGASVGRPGEAQLVGRSIVPA